MGSFSWTKADGLTKVSNIVEGAPFKFLIPKEFGGGFIKDNYQDYGYLGTKENGEPKYDMYEVMAFWNKEIIDQRATAGKELHEKLVAIYSTQGIRVPPITLQWDGEFPNMKEIDKYTNDNAGLGVDIGCYDEQVDNLKYPLKLVSASFKCTYEDLDTRSYRDPHQGFFPTYRTQQ